MPKVSFLALVKDFNKKQLVSGDSEVKITLRTRDFSIIPTLNNDLSSATQEAKITIETNDE